MPKKTCFVVMGFGKKTDYSKPKTFDLDKTYEYIIKPAAEKAGLKCVRADEIVHAGNINVPMYEQLLKADVVVADVSTYNCNAFYELGVRHALRPYTTIVISEDGLTFPFDVGQIAIRKYHHLGEGIDYEEVGRMQKELSEAMKIDHLRKADGRQPRLHVYQGSETSLGGRGRGDRFSCGGAPVASSGDARSCCWINEQPDPECSHGAGGKVP